MTSSTTNKRLLQELKQTHSADLPSCLQSLKPVSEDSLLTWHAVLKGAPDTPYSEGQWLLSISIPPSYPLQPPLIKFLTPCCHPNIHFATGEICLSLLKDAWTPAYTLISTLEAIAQLLAYPEVDSPLNVDVAALWRSGDEVGARAVVRYWCTERRYETREVED